MWSPKTPGEGAAFSSDQVIKKKISEASTYLDKTLKRMAVESEHNFDRTSCDGCDLCCVVMEGTEHPKTTAYEPCAMFDEQLDGSKGCVLHEAGKPLKCQQTFCGYRMGMTDTHPNDSGFYMELSNEYQGLNSAVGAEKTSAMVVHFSNEFPVRGTVAPGVKKLQKLTEAMAIMGSLVVWKAKDQVILYGPLKLSGVAWSRPEKDS